MLQCDIAVPFAVSFSPRLGVRVWNKGGVEINIDVHIYKGYSYPAFNVGITSRRGVVQQRLNLLKQGYDGVLRLASLRKVPCE